MAATIWRGHITFGLVSIPVRLSKAARSEKISLREVYRPAPQEPGQTPPAETPSRGRKTGRAAPPVEEVQQQEEPAVSRIRLKPVNEASQETVSRADVLKGYEYEKDRYVVLERADLESIAAETDREMEIQEFVHMQEIDPVYLETSYYVIPESSGEKAYALLFTALRETGYVGIAQFAMHRREHVVILHPGSRGILLHTMYYEQEIRKDEEYKANQELVGKKEVELASMLVESMAGPFEPAKYHDTYREKLEALIAAKIKGKATAPAQAKSVKAPVVDILEALQNSLKNVKKPVAREAQGGSQKRSGAR